MSHSNSHPWKQQPGYIHVCNNCENEDDMGNWEYGQCHGQGCTCSPPLQELLPPKMDVLSGFIISFEKDHYYEALLITYVTGSSVVL